MSLPQIFAYRFVMVCPQVSLQSDDPVGLTALLSGDSQNQAVLVGGLEHEWIMTFHSVGNGKCHPTWRTHSMIFGLSIGLNHQAVFLGWRSLSKDHWWHPWDPEFSRKIGWAWLRCFPGGVFRSLEYHNIPMICVETAQKSPLVIFPFYLKSKTLDG